MTDEYIGIDFGSPIIIGCFKIQCITSYIMAYPAIEGSNDNSVWTTICTTTLGNSTSLQTIAFYNINSYRYWRIRNTGGVYSGEKIAIAELQMLERTGVM